MRPLQGRWVENCAMNKGKPPNKELAKIKVFNDLQRYKNLPYTNNIILGLSAWRLYLIGAGSHVVDVVRVAE